MRKHYIIYFVTFIVLISCSKKSDVDIKSDSKNAIVSNVAEIVSVLKRPDKAPNFTWKDKNGRQVDFDAYRGKVTLINFWATWCGPCKKELPDLIAISKEMSNRGVKIIGISTDRGTNVREDVASYISEKGIPYQIVISNEEIEEAFGNVRLIPTTFVIDPDGKIAQTIVGARPKEAFVDIINSLLHGPN